jgi:hypothetical protein
MPRETNNQPPPDGGVQPAADATATQTEGSDEPNSNTAEEYRNAAEEVRAAVKRREAALARAKEAEAKAAELERRERQRQLEAMSLEQQNEALKKELDELRAKEAAVARKRNADAFLSKVVDQTRLDPAVVRGLLLAAKEDEGLEIAPEDFTANDVKHAASVLRKLSPSSFEPRVGGAPPPAPGVNTRVLPPHELPAADQSDYWATAARAGGSQNLRR